MNIQTEHRAKERQHALQAIEWMELAIYSIEKADYPATAHAINVARRHLDEAEGLERVRQDR